MKQIVSIILLCFLGIFVIIQNVKGSYSNELQGAYNYAYGMGITTQSSIDTADMNGSLLRSHMAKMMSNYAREVLGRVPDTSLSCIFTDLTGQTTEMKGYIKTACQLGLMGNGLTVFNPNSKVTRAEFGTVLSRALYGNANNGGNPYYIDHLQALNNAGIMSNISNPNAYEIRGYVMLMLQRASGANNDNNATDSSNCTIEEWNTCTDDIQSSHEVTCSLNCYVGSNKKTMDLGSGRSLSFWIGVSKFPLFLDENTGSSQFFFIESNFSDKNTQASISHYKWLIEPGFDDKLILDFGKDFSFANCSNQGCVETTRIDMTKIQNASDPYEIVVFVSGISNEKSKCGINNLVGRYIMIANFKYLNNQISDFNIVSNENSIFCNDPEAVKRIPSYTY